MSITNILFEYIVITFILSLVIVVNLLLYLIYKLDFIIGIYV